MTNQPTSREFILGTSPQGKDVFSQLIWGGRQSLLIGFAAGGFMIVLATITGMIARVLPRRRRQLLNLIMDRSW